MNENVTKNSTKIVTSLFLLDKLKASFSFFFIKQTKYPHFLINNNNF